METDKRSKADKVAEFFTNKTNLLKSIQRVAKKIELSEAKEWLLEIGKFYDSKFVLDKDNIFTYGSFLRWLHCEGELKALNTEGKRINGDFTKGIYISGNTGSGKSWCFDIMKAYTLAQGIQYKPAYNDKLRYLSEDWKIVTASQIVTDFTLDASALVEYRKVPILCIQDLGSEPQEALYMGNRINVLQNILEFRGDNRKTCITMISSNYSINNKKLAEMYGGRVISRLYEMCNYYEMTGKDRRLL